MAWQIQPIFAALRHHRLAALLIALEIALACAVLCNACFLIIAREQRMKLVSGVDEASLAMLQLTGFDSAGVNDLNARMLSGLRSIQGVQSVSVINQVPFGPQAGVAGISLSSFAQHTSGVVDFYIGSPGSMQALGLKLVAGRAPLADEYVPVADFVPKDSRVLVTRSLAEHLWPGADPLGKEFWCLANHFHVIGVIDRLAIAQPGSLGPESVGWSVFVPGQPGAALAGSYLLRADPAELPRVLRDARLAVAKLAPDAVLDQEDSRTMGDFRYQYFENDRAMIRLLLGVIMALLLVTALGIVGLASFWVQQRRKQIGIRRAVGATRGDILRYFQTENFLIVTTGIAIGVALAYALNLLLMRTYEVSHLPIAYLLIGAATLWLLGQLAVLAPALRAAAVPPVVATRSV